MHKADLMTITRLHVKIDATWRIIHQKDEYFWVNRGTKNLLLINIQMVFDSIYLTSQYFMFLVLKMAIFKIKQIKIKSPKTEMDDKQLWFHWRCRNWYFWFFLWLNKVDELLNLEPFLFCIVVFYTEKSKLIKLHPKFCENVCFSY